MSKAEPLYLKVLDIQKKVQGTDHPEMMKVQKDYDELLQKMYRTQYRSST
jgi:hypothetical protein